MSLLIFDDINNSEQIFLRNFYITYKNNQDLNNNFETNFPLGDYEEDVQEIWYRFKHCQLKKSLFEILI